MLIIAVVALCSLAVHCVTAARHHLATGDDDVNELSIDFDSLNTRLETVDLRPFNKPKRTCKLNLHSHTCVLEELKKVMAVKAYLESGESPGKRDSQQSDDASADDLLPPEETVSYKKRQCGLNLPGNTCTLEKMEKLKITQDYLKSEKSPGKRDSQQSDDASADDLLPPEETGSLEERRCDHNLHGHDCALRDMILDNDAKSYLESGESPGKRDSQQSNDASADDLLPPEETGSYKISQDVDEQKQVISKLWHLLNEIRPDTENIPTVKKDCRFRLGGHCLTESADRAANQYYYLKSPKSPGRRRRGVSASFQKQTRQCM